MNRKPLSWNIKQVCTMVQKGTITFDNPVQRPSNQWKIENKSLLIHSILSMFIPDIYAIQVPKEVNSKIINTYDIIDGKQRLTIINDYKQDQFALTQLPLIKLESTGEQFDISNLKFSELPEEVRDEINGFTITFRVIELEEDDDEENIVDEIFYRLNNGTPVSKEHLSLVSAPKHIQNFVRSTIDNHALFTNVAHFPDGSIKKSDREMTMLQTITLVSGLEFTSFAAKDIEEFFRTNTIDESILTIVNDLYTTIANIFSNEKSKFITKISIPSLSMFLHLSDNSQNVHDFILDYPIRTKKGDAYKRYTGSGCTKHDAVMGRIKGLQELYNQFKS